MVSRLFFVQVIHSSSYKEEADRQYSTPSSNIFDRGNIYFTKKDGKSISAATLVSGFKIALRPKEITDVDDTYKKLSTVVEFDYDTFLQRASKKNDPYKR